MMEGGTLRERDPLPNPGVGGWERGQGCFPREVRLGGGVSLCKWPWGQESGNSLEQMLNKYLFN